MALAAALKEVLPPAKSSSAVIFYDHSSDPWFKERYGAVVKKPQDVGQKTTLSVTVDDRGNFTFDAIVKQNENAKRIVYSQHRDLIPKILKDNEEEEEEEYADDEKLKEIEETRLQTTKALMNVNKSFQTQSQESKFMKYKHSGAGEMQRMIRMEEMPVDQLEPSKFKHKRVPKGNRSPPVPVMHSPPQPVTVQDQKDWKVSPCISNWKNTKGYTIPLDKRLAADGRGLQEVQVNNKFAQFYEALYVAEQHASETLSMRSKVLKEMMLKEKEKKEQELRALAQKARSERTTAGSGSFVTQHAQSNNHETKEEREERVQREKTRKESCKERERKNRLEAKDAAMGKKRKITRDQDRDMSEKVALGMASSAAGAGCEVMYDQRLFNQEKGMDSGFGFVTEDQYCVYDKGLFSAQPTLSTLYRPKKDCIADEMYDKRKIRKTDRFTRAAAVEFEREDAADPFGLDQFLTQVKGAKKL